MAKKKRSEQKIKEAKFTRKHKLLMAVALVISLLYMRSKNRIIGYPDYLFLYTLLSFFAIFTFIYKHKIIEQFNILRKKRDDISLILTMMNVIVGAYFSSILLFVFINYYNIHTSKSNPFKYVDCKIHKVHVSQRKGHKIFYEFESDVQVTKIDFSYIYDFKKKSSYDDYVFELKLREGIWGSSIIEGGTIKRK